MDTSEILTLVVAVVTLVAGVVTIWRAMRRRRLSLASGNDPLRPHRFTKRRVTMGVLMVVVAAAVFLGEFVFKEYFIKHPAWIGWYWIGVVGLLLWLTGLALFDMVQVMFSSYDIPPDEPTSGLGKGGKDSDK